MLRSRDRDQRLEAGASRLALEVRLCMGVRCTEDRLFLHFLYRFLTIPGTGKLGAKAQLYFDRIRYGLKRPRGNSESRVKLKEGFAQGLKPNSFY